jgi:hypothetical protein
LDPDIGKPGEAKDPEALRPGEALNPVAGEQTNLTMKSSVVLLKSLTTSVEEDLEKTQEQQEDDIYLEETLDALPFVIRPNKTVATVSEPVPMHKKGRKARKKKGRKRNGRKRKRRKKKMRGSGEGKGRTLLFRRYQEKRRQRLRQQRLRKGKQGLDADTSGAAVARRRMFLGRQGRRRRLGGGKLRQLWTQSQKYQDWRRQQSQEQLLAQPGAQLAIEQLWQGLFRQGQQWKQIYQVNSSQNSGQKNLHMIISNSVAKPHHFLRFRLLPYCIARQNF